MRPIDEVFRIPIKRFQRRKVAVFALEFSTRVTKQSAQLFPDLAQPRSEDLLFIIRVNGQQGDIDVDAVLAGQSHKLAKITGHWRLWPHALHLQSVVDESRPELHFIVDAFHEQLSTVRSLVGSGERLAQTVVKVIV